MDDIVWAGHSIVGYGYDESITFNVKGPGSSNVTLPGFAVMDTWTDGSNRNMSNWLGWDGVSRIDPYIDGDLVEWWPFYDLDVSYAYYYTYPNPYFYYDPNIHSPQIMDWMIVDGTEFFPTPQHGPPVPEPSTIILFGIGVLSLFGLSLRRKQD